MKIYIFCNHHKTVFCLTYATLLCYWPQHEQTELASLSYVWCLGITAAVISTLWQNMPYCSITLWKNMLYCSITLWQNMPYFSIKVSQFKHLSFLGITFLICAQLSERLLMSIVLTPTQPYKDKWTVLLAAEATFPPS